MNKVLNFKKMDEKKMNKIISRKEILNNADEYIKTQKKI